jgi:TDG/mug DNA glycosylase family protein
MVECFKPILGKLPHTLVLGSSPSVISLEKVEYYGNSRNAFWPILNDVFGGNGFKDYKAKVDFAIDNHIAIWDVVATCTRNGSLDSAIKDVVANDIEEVLMSNPSIKTVLFNGATAAKFYKRYIKYYPYRVEFFTMPSTSPAYTIPYERKLDEWEAKLY